MNCTVFQTFRRTLSSGSEEEIPDTGTAQSTEDSEETYPNPLLEESAPKRATDFYKSAIKRVGLSASKMVSASQPSTSKALKEIQPYLAEEEMLDDDWLIDDMRPTGKKRRLDVNDVFSKNSVSSSQRAPKRKKRSDEYEPNRVPVLPGDANDGQHHITDHPCLQDQNIDDDFLPNDICFISENENSNDSVETRPKSRLSRKPKQVKLTNFGIRKSSMSSFVADENRNKDDLPPLEVASNQNHLLPGNSYPNVGASLSSSLSSSQMVPGILSQSALFPVKNLKVTVKDKKLLVPVFEK